MVRGRDFYVSTLSSRDWAPFAFVFFAVSGCAAVAASKYLGLPTWALVCIPLVIIVGYGLTAWHLPRLELRRDQIGDNLYYLGFLLTLVSLTVTLAQYSEGSENDYIVSNFGLALVATIVGIAGRTFMNQMRKDVVGVEREVQVSLSEASVRLRSQMHASLENFGSFQRQMAQVAQESTAVIAESHKELAQALVKIVEEQARVIQKATDESSAWLRSTIEDSTSRVLSSADENIKSMHSVSSGFAESIETQAQAIDRRVELFITEFERKHAASLDQLERQQQTAGETLEVLARGQEALRGIHFDPTALNQFQAQFDEAFTKLNEVTRRFGTSASSEIDAFVASARAITSELEAIKSAIEDSRKQEQQQPTSYAILQSGPTAEVRGSQEADSRDRATSIEQPNASASGRPYGRGTPEAQDLTSFIDPADNNLESTSSLEGDDPKKDIPQGSIIDQRLSEPLESNSSDGLNENQASDATAELGSASVSDNLVSREVASIEVNDQNQSEPESSPHDTPTRYVPPAFSEQGDGDLSGADSRPSAESEIDASKRNKWKMMSSFRRW